MTKNENGPGHLIDGSNPSGESQTSRIIVDNTVRWCNDILTEVQRLHERHLSESKREKLQAIRLSLQDMFETVPLS